MSTDSLQNTRSHAAAFMHHLARLRIFQSQYSPAALTKQHSRHRIYAAAVPLEHRSIYAAALARVLCTPSLQVDEDLSERISPLPRRQNPEKVDSAEFHQLITPQQWTEGRPPQQWQIQNYVCHVLEKTNLPIWNRLDNGLAGSWQQELGFK